MHRHPANIAIHDESSFGDRAAEKLAEVVGSWRFVIWQNVVVGAWVAFNCLAIFGWHWDPYPFILLNLVFSWQASNTGPVLQLSQNRQAHHDRLRAEHDYHVNQETLAWVRALSRQQGISPDPADTAPMDAP